MEYCKTSMELAEIYYALHRTDDAIRVLEGIVVVDEKNDSVKAKEALDDIQIALAEEAKGIPEESSESALEINIVIRATIIAARCKEESAIAMVE